MMQPEEPFVSVVTPVYNGAKYLAECIESVMAQTYENWEYVIVNNRSSDTTRDIANRYADKDARIRVVDNEEFLPQIANWNHALRAISKESTYCKVVHADDWIFPECIQKMVEVAETNPSVAIVGAYVMERDRIILDGLPYPSPCISGRDICRWTLLGRLYAFGTPTSILVRSDVVRETDPFYDESVMSADLMACYEVLKTHDFGFVHQVLTCTRMHDDTTTSGIWKYDRAWRQVRLIALARYGPDFLSREEFDNQLKLQLEGYYTFLAKSAMRMREKGFWMYHARGFKSVGYRMSVWRLIKALCWETSDIVGNPKTTIARVVKKLRRKGPGNREVTQCDSSQRIDLRTE